MHGVKGMGPCMHGVMGMGPCILAATGMGPCIHTVTVLTFEFFPAAVEAELQDPGPAVLDLSPAVDGDTEGGQDQTAWPDQGTHALAIACQMFSSTDYSLLRVTWGSKFIALLNNSTPSSCITELGPHAALDASAVPVKWGLSVTKNGTVAVLLEPSSVESSSSREPIVAMALSSCVAAVQRHASSADWSGGSISANC